MTATPPPRPNTDGITILYDGECPFCSAYIRLTRLRASVGPVRLVNARSDDPLVAEARIAGLDLNRGMVVKLDGQLHHGDAAMVLLATLSTGSGVVNSLMRWAFRTPNRARLLYPLLVTGRNLTLRLLGRRPIPAPPNP